MRKYDSTQVGQLKRRLKLWQKEADTGRYGIQAIAKKMVLQIRKKIHVLENQHKTKA